MERNELYPCGVVVEVDILGGEHRRYQIPICNMLVQEQYVPHRSITFKFEPPIELENWADEFINWNKKEVDE